MGSTLKVPFSAIIDGHYHQLPEIRAHAAVVLDRTDYQELLRKMLVDKRGEWKARLAELEAEVKADPLEIGDKEATEFVQLRLCLSESSADLKKLSESELTRGQLSDLMGLDISLLKRLHYGQDLRCAATIVLGNFLTPGEELENFLIVHNLSMLQPFGQTSGSARGQNQKVKIAAKVSLRRKANLAVGSLVRMANVVDQQQRNQALNLMMSCCAESEEAYLKAVSGVIWLINSLDESNDYNEKITSDVESALRFLGDPGKVLSEKSQEELKSTLLGILHDHQLESAVAGNRSWSLLEKIDPDAANIARASFEAEINNYKGGSKEQGDALVHAVGALSYLGVEAIRPLIPKIIQILDNAQGKPGEQVYPAGALAVINVSSEEAVRALGRIVARDYLKDISEEELKLLEVTAIALSKLSPDIEAALPSLAVSRIPNVGEERAGVREKLKEIEDDINDAAEEALSNADPTKDYREVVRELVEILANPPQGNQALAVRAAQMLVHFGHATKEFWPTIAKVEKETDYDSIKAAILQLRYVIDSDQNLFHLMCGDS